MRPKGTFYKSVERDMSSECWAVDEKLEQGMNVAGLRRMLGWTSEINK